MNAYKILAVSGVLALSWLNVSGQSFLTNGLVAHYPLNGNANNVFGTNNGTIVGATLTSNRQGHANSAYRFNGTSSRIEFNAPPIAQVMNWTLSAWIKPAALPQHGIAVNVGMDNGSSGDGFGFGFNNSSTWEALLPATPGGWRSSGQVIGNTNAWYHVVMLRASGNLLFYINGNQSVDAGPITYSVPTDFTIGGQNNNLRYFNGLIDDVRIYNRALSANEVAQLYSYNEICSPHAATATATLVNGFVVGATITDYGCGYTSAPPVSISGGGGSNATATATISGGMVTAINITAAGCCYTNPPRIVIGSPPFVPTLSIRVSKVRVTQRLMVGRNYVLEATTDLVNWTPTGPPFTAQSESTDSEFDVDVTGRYFRVSEVP